MGKPSAEMIEAVKAEAAARGWSPQDLLGIIGYETGGTYDPWQKGPTTKWGEHRGLIQWGEPQRKQYGVSKDMSVSDQVKAAGQYLSDRGLKSGMGTLPMYAAINAGNIDAVNASDENSGGAPGSVTDKVLSSNFQDHMRNSASYLGEDYVPPIVSGVPREGRASDEYNSAEGVPPVPDSVPPVPDSVPVITGNETIDGILVSAKDLAIESAVSSLFGGGQSDPPPKVAAPPPLRPVQFSGPVSFKIKRKKEKE